MRRVIGVMGHVDHGKTALVRALTGMETDRLAEEQRRGISIALGFAHYKDASGAVIDLIDMPGHERFIRTMVSGATGIDAALLVVSANEGIKPQTIEHLDIASLLGVERVVIAVSKTDLVEPGVAEAAAVAAATRARKSGMAVFAAVLTSAHTGAGLDTLRTALAAALRDLPPPVADGFPYLPIDRVFTVPGHGTVVTGTLRRGVLTVSDDVTVVPGGRAVLVPGGRAVRLRSVQVHGARTTSAQPGQRVAANLRDVEPGEIAHGAALTANGHLPPSQWLSVSLRAVEGASPLQTTLKYVLLFGTEEVEVRLRLLDRDELAPGEEGLAQLRCVSPVSAPARERFILRRISPPETIAGGRIIDPAATRLRRKAPGVLAQLSAIANAEPAAILQACVTAGGAMGVPLTRLAQLAGTSAARAAELMQKYQITLGRSGVAVLRTEFDRAIAAVPAALRDQDVPRDRLTTLIPWASAAVLDDAVAELVRRGAVVRAGGAIRLHAPQRDRDRADAEAASATRLAEALRQGGLSPPDPGRIAPGPQTKRLVDRLIKEGVVVRAVDKVQKREILFHQDAIEAAKRSLAPLLAKSPGVLVGEAGAALGISRKYCVPLLEHLDSIHFTRRVADRRMLADPR